VENPVEGLGARKRRTVVMYPHRSAQRPTPSASRQSGTADIRRAQTRLALTDPR
jgi:hypothetical protein